MEYYAIVAHLSADSKNFSQYCCSEKVRDVTRDP